MGEDRFNCLGLIQGRDGISRGREPQGPEADGSRGPGSVVQVVQEGAEEGDGGAQEEDGGLLENVRGFRPSKFWKEFFCFCEGSCLTNLFGLADDESSGAEEVPDGHEATPG